METSWKYPLNLDLRDNGSFTGFFNFLEITCKYIGNTM